MHKKNLAVVLGSTDNYFFATGTVVLNLLRFSPNLADDIIIYYDRIAERDREILECEFGCKLVYYELPLWLQVDAGEGVRKFTPLSLSIYEIFNLLGGYRNVLWLDSDVCIQADISGILDFPGDVCIRHGGTRFADALGRPVNPEIDRKPTHNTGVVLVRDSLPNYRYIAKQCYDYTQRFAKTLILPDQAVLNYVLWRNKITPTDIGRDYNYTVHHDFHSFNKAKIFHLACDYKFWNHSVLRNLFPIWRECYEQWLSLGGSKFSGELKFHEIGPKLSIMNILTFMKLSESGLITRQLLIDEQARAIAKLESNVAELLGLLRIRSH